jgi:hypothetical protein
MRGLLSLLSALLFFSCGSPGDDPQPDIASVEDTPIAMDVEEVTATVLPLNFVPDPGIRVDKATNAWASVAVQPDGRLVFTYIGDMGPDGYNNVRMAISTDNGKTFDWEEANILDDAQLVDAGGHSSCSYVDPKPTVLEDGAIWYFVMTQACEPPAPSLGRATGYIHSFYSSDGVHFTKDEGIRLQPSDFDWETFGFVVYSLNDPTVVRLVDGRFRMFVTATVCESQDPFDCEVGGAGNIRSVLVSATAAPE